jgi:hypothetical protein
LGETDTNLALMYLIVTQFLGTPLYGAQVLTWDLLNEGRSMHDMSIRRLMFLMDLMPIHLGPNTSTPAQGHNTCPYPLRRLRVDRAGQVWCARDHVHGPGFADHIHRPDRPAEAGRRPHFVGPQGRCIDNPQAFFRIDVCHAFDHRKALAIRERRMRLLARLGDRFIAKAGMAHWMVDAGVGRIGHAGLMIDESRFMLATVTGRRQNSGWFAGSPISADEWITDVCRLKDGNWHCVLTHLTPAHGRAVRQASK